MIYPRILLGDLDLTAAPFMWEFGGDFGGPEVVYETLLSLLRDGSSVSSTRVDNRTFSLSVIIDAADFLSLAQYEAALVAECDKPRNTLTFEPGDAFGPATVFDTFRASATLQRDDDLEQAFTRRWSLTITALPWARSADLTVTPAVTTATETLIDACSSLTGWSLVTGASIALVGGAAVQVTSNAPAAEGASAAIARTGVVSFVTGRFIKATWTSTAAPTSLSLALDGVGLVEAARFVVTGVNESYFAVPVGVTSGTVLTFSAFWSGSITAQSLNIGNVSHFTSLPYIGTAKQMLNTFIPGGSVRTQGSLAAQHATSALGTALVYTYEAGFGWTPPLRLWRTSGTAPGADGTAVSGFSQTLGAATVYSIPASILPQGSYLVMVRVKGTAASHTFTTTTNVAISSAIAASVVTLTTGTVFANTAYHFETLGRLTLPSFRIGPSGNVWVSVAADVNVTLDEVYLFHEDGDLTVVDCGTAAPGAGGTSNRLWIDAPSLDDPMGSVWVGYSADRSDAVAAGTLCTARPPYGHNLQPAGVNVFTVTSNADTAAVSSTHFKRWHTNAAD